MKQWKVWERKFEEAGEKLAKMKVSFSEREILKK